MHKGHQILVSEQREVEFQVGNYKDKVICDIMPMDVCHILLCKPWKFDRHVIHDVRSNCYKFKKDGTKNILFSLQEGGATELDIPKTLLLSGKEFLQQIQEEEVCFVIICIPKVVLMKNNIAYLTYEVRERLGSMT